MELLLHWKEKFDQDEHIGLEIIRRACEEPLRLIATNAGKEASVIANESRKTRMLTVIMPIATSLKT